MYSRVFLFFLFSFFFYDILYFCPQNLKISCLVTVVIFQVPILAQNEQEIALYCSPNMRLFITSIAVTS